MTTIRAIGFCINLASIGLILSLPGNASADLSNGVCDINDWGSVEGRKGVFSCQSGNELVAGDNNQDWDYVKSNQSFSCPFTAQWEGCLPTTTISSHDFGMNSSDVGQPGAGGGASLAVFSTAWHDPTLHAAVRDNFVAAGSVVIEDGPVPDEYCANYAITCDADGFVSVLYNGEEVLQSTVAITVPMHFTIINYDKPATVKNLTITAGQGPLTVNIDIKPGSDPNSINPKSKGVIPVAILTTSDFDATQVNALSVEFGHNGANETHGQGHVEDVDVDGDQDMVLHFNTQETGIRCGDTDTPLTGETVSEEVFTGTDSIQTVGCKKK
jgi:hypothetical protein